MHPKIPWDGVALLRVGRTPDTHANSVRVVHLVPVLVGTLVLQDPVYGVASDTLDLSLTESAEKKFAGHTVRDIIHAQLDAPEASHAAADARAARSPPQLCWVAPAFSSPGCFPPAPVVPDVRQLLSDMYNARYQVLCSTKYYPCHHCQKQEALFCSSSETSAARSWPSPSPWPRVLSESTQES